MRKDDEDDDDDDDDEVTNVRNRNNEFITLFLNAIVNGSNIEIHPGGSGPPGRIPENHVWNMDNDDDLELQAAIERSINER